VALAGRLCHPPAITALVCDVDVTFKRSEAKPGDVPR